jgi:signal transduction histidine kinase
MRERVAVFGGRLVAEPRPGGGFRLMATLPYAEPAGTP